MTVLLITFTLFVGSCDEPGRTQNTVVSAINNSIITGDTVSQLSNNIMVIYQDKKNNYWFGSWQDGLYKYDGKFVIHYSMKHGLPSDRVEEIKEDKQGNIYVNTSEGIIKYDGNYFLLLKDTNEDTEKWGLWSNDLWFKNFTDGQFVYRYDGIMLHKLKLPKNKSGEEWAQKHSGSPNPYAVYCTYKDSKGNIWFGTAASGVLRYDGSRFDWITESDVNEFHYGPSNGVRSMIEDKDSYFWFNTEYKYGIYNNLSSVKSGKDSIVFYDRIKSIGCLDGKTDGVLNEYLSIIKDNENNLWIATYLDGVWKYDGKKIKHFPIQIETKNIPVFYLYNGHRLL